AGGAREVGGGVAAAHARRSLAGALARRGGCSSVVPRFWGVFRIARFIVYATAIDYLAWVIDRHRESSQAPVWLGMARIGLFFVTLWACVIPSMFVWERVAVTLRAKHRDPESFAHRLAVALAIVPPMEALIAAVSVGPAADVY